jgi:hypothetical protein
MIAYKNSDFLITFEDAIKLEVGHSFYPNHSWSAFQGEGDL